MLEGGAHNFTVLVAEVVAGGALELPLPAEDDGGPLEKYEQPAAAEGDDYQRIMADVWVGAVLTLLIFSCICCVCSCLLYHKFRQWKTRAVQARSLAEAATAVGRGAAVGAEAGAAAGDAESLSLPSYTLVSGLPSYDEALDQLRRARLPPDRGEPAKLSAEQLFAACKVFHVS